MIIRLCSLFLVNTLNESITTLENIVLDNHFALLYFKYIRIVALLLLRIIQVSSLSNIHIYVSSFSLEKLNRNTSSK